VSFEKLLSKEEAPFYYLRSRLRQLAASGIRTPLVHQPRPPRKESVFAALAFIGSGENSLCFRSACSSLSSDHPPQHQQKYSDLNTNHYITQTYFAWM